MATDDKPTNIRTSSPAKKTTAKLSDEPLAKEIAITTNAKTTTAETAAKGGEVSNTPAKKKVVAKSTIKSSNNPPNKETVVAAVNTTTAKQEKSIHWQSGDWQKNQNTSPPYNGLEVQAIPVYGDTGTLENVAITIVDYSLTKEGAKIPLQFSLNQIVNETKATLIPQVDSSTLDGFVGFRLLQGASDYANLFLSLAYMENSVSSKNIQGCILQVPLKNS